MEPMYSCLNLAIKGEDFKELFLFRGWVGAYPGESVGLQVAAARWPPTFLLQTTPPPAAEVQKHRYLGPWPEAIPQPRAGNSSDTIFQISSHPHWPELPQHLQQQRTPPPLPWKWVIGGRPHYLRSFMPQFCWKWPSWWRWKWRCLLGLETEDKSERNRTWKDGIIISSGEGLQIKSENHGSGYLGPYQEEDEGQLPWSGMFNHSSSVNNLVLTYWHGAVLKD